MRFEFVRDEHFPRWRATRFMYNVLPDDLDDNDPEAWSDWMDHVGRFIQNVVADVAYRGISDTQIIHLGFLMPDQSQLFFNRVGGSAITVGDILYNDKVKHIIDDMWEAFQSNKNVDIIGSVLKIYAYDPPPESR